MTLSKILYHIQFFSTSANITKEEPNPVLSYLCVIQANSTFLNLIE